MKKKKKDRPPWNAHISCMRSSISAHVTWINAGRPSRDHPLSMDRRDTKRLLRRATRCENAQRWHDLYNRIMDSHSNPDKYFFHIIAKQRSHSTVDHFDNLGTPLEDPTFDANYRSQVVEEVHFPSCKFSSPTLLLYRGNLSRHKAPECKPASRCARSHGWTPRTARTVVSYLRRLMNAISVANYIPPGLCCGDLITIPKKGKDLLAMNNHRGITITSVLGKLLEHLLVSRVRALLGNLSMTFSLGSHPVYPQVWRHWSALKCLPITGMRRKTYM